MSAVPRAVVVVSAYNQVPYLERTLRGWLRQTTRDFCVAVADDGSGPEMFAFMEAVAPEFEAEGLALQHVWQEDEGFRKARILNEAVRRAPPAPLIVFADGDCIPPARFVERHLAAHEPRSFQVAGVYRLTREQSEALTVDDVRRGTFETLRPADGERALRKKRRKSVWGTLLRRRNRPKVQGGNLGVDRGLFEEINGYDEQFVQWGLEDSDLRDRAMRLRPRPRVKVLYCENDMWHLWHPRNSTAPDGRAPNRGYYRQERPARCVHGLVPPGDGAAPAD